MAVSARSLLDPRVTLTAAQERDFFQSIRLPNGVFKTTTDRRMDDLNALVVDCLKKAGAAPREILDVAASSGISSVELVETLASGGFDAQLTATDLSLSATLVALSRNHYVLVDRSGEILQHTIFGVSLRPWPRRMDVLTGYWLVRRIANAVARASLAGRSSGETVMLVSGRAKVHPRISFVEDDVLADAPDGLARRFDVVRAANVLNRSYFSAADLARAVDGLVTRMRGPGSFLVVARTLEDGTNNGTVFQLNDNDGFDVVSRLGEGSEIEDIVLASAESRRGRHN